MRNDHSREPKPAVSTRASRRHWVVLGLIIAIGISLRFYGLHWGYPVHLHCDENTTLGIAVNLGRQFLQTGCLRPQASCYGALSLYLLLVGLGPLGILLAPIACALAGGYLAAYWCERRQGKSRADAREAGWGALLGRLAGGLTKAVLASVMVALILRTAF